MTEKKYPEKLVDLSVELANQDVEIHGLKNENEELSYEIRCLKDELDTSKKREEIAIACLCQLREQGNEDAIQTLEELLVK